MRDEPSQRGVILSGVPCGRRRDGTQSKDPVESRATSLGTPRGPSTALRPPFRLRSAQDDRDLGQVHWQRTFCRRRRRWAKRAGTVAQAPSPCATVVASRCATAARPALRSARRLGHRGAFPSPGPVSRAIGKPLMVRGLMANPAAANRAGIRQAQITVVTNNQ